MKPSSLKVKISAAIMVTGFFISLSIATVLYPFEKERRHTYLENIHVLLNAVFTQKKELIANEIYADQTEALMLSLKEIKEIEKVSHVLIYDTKGQVMASTATGSDILKKFAAIDIKAIDPAAEFTQIQYMENHYANFFSPIEIIGVHVGYIRILYNLNTFERESRMVVIFFGILFLILLVIIVLLNMFLSHSVILPTSRLRNAMGQLQAGESGVQVSISSQDEIGQMASAFNEMSLMIYQQKTKLTDAITAKDAYALRLKKSNTALELLNKSLETRVQERTAELSRSNRRLKAEIDERQRAYREKRELEKRLNRSKKMETLGLLAGGGGP